MSKYRKGNYDTGEPKFIYLKRHKHFPNTKTAIGKLRQKLWIVKCNVWDIQFEKKLKSVER